MWKSVLNRKLKRDYAVSSAILLIAAIAAVRIDIFEMLYTASRNHEGLELDEIFSVLIVFSVIALVFTIRRISDLKTDITLRMKIEDELNNKNLELTERIKEIKQLQGIIPICANCKKIRSSDGYWLQVEKYISSHSEAVFTHSLCDECVEKLYPGLNKK